MKIGLISDLHTDATEDNSAIVPYLIDAIREAELDIFVLAGDVTPKLSEFYDILGRFDKANLNGNKLFVPGNHDIWVSKNAKMTSDQKCNVISEICKDHGFYNLNDEPYITKDIGFCGTIGWYDYSFAPIQYDISIEEYAEKQLMNTIWSDKKYAKWKNPDHEVAHNFERKLRNQIDSIKEKVQRMIVVTHHVPFRECIRYQGELQTDYFRAFYGSEGLGAICLNEPLISHVLFGHVHYPVNQQVQNIRAMCAPIGYLHEKPANGLLDYVQQRLTCFTLATD